MTLTFVLLGLLLFALAMLRRAAAIALAVLIGWERWSTRDLSTTCVAATAAFLERSSLPISAPTLARAAFG